MKKEQKISLRERKYAQTKIDLVKAAIDLMQEKRLKDIAVKELCEAIPISEVTFYNYFPKKTDLMGYVAQLWGTEMHWHIRKWEQEKSALKVIESLFALAAQKIEENPVVLSEALRVFVQKLKKPCFKKLSVAERLIAFPDLPGIEEIEVVDMEFSELVHPYLEQAAASGELPQQCDTMAVAAMLETLHIGAMMKIHWKGNLPLQSLYYQQLQIIWDGLWAQSGQTRPLKT